MPMMKLRRSKKPPQGAKSDAEIGVNENRLPLIEQSICADRPFGETQRDKRHQRDSLGQNLIDRMDPGRREPVKLFNTVVNGVESPQPWNGMKHAMGPVESEIGKHNDQRYLNPIRQTSDRGLNGRRDNLRGRENACDNDGEETELYQHAVQKQEDEIVRPTPTKNLLLRMHGEQPLKRHEHKTGDENNLEAKGIHGALR